jgi:4-hydroxybenzoate polyprenyltransferase
MVVVSPRLEMQRSAGKFAIFLAGVYALVLFALVVSTVTGSPIPLVGWPMALVPAAAFGYSFIDAVKLHRTTDGPEATRLWRRSLLYAVIGTALTVVAVVVINQITPV